MRHLNLVFDSAGTGRNSKRTPYLMNASPKLCWGCEKPFPVRDGRREAQVGQDGRLYCFNMTRECAVLAVNPAALKRAS
jgi:hypothetical protein